MKPKKKILVFIDWFTPGYKAGGPIQSCANLIEHLKDNFEFSVITRDTDYCETRPYPSVRSNEWNLLREGLKVYYFSADKLNKKNISAILRNEKFDRVFLNSVFSFYFTLYPLWILKKFGFRHTTLASRGMFAKSALAIKPFKKKIFLLAAKSVKLFNNVTFNASSLQEENEIKNALGNNTMVKIAANLPKKNILQPFKFRVKYPGSLKLINIARISPEKNLKYALEILLTAKQRICFDIYGPVYNKQYWSACKEVIAQMPKNISINYKGAIQNDEIARTMLDYHFMFMPTLGENFGHIIIESLCSGTPVIISDNTIWRNTNNKPAIGWNIPLEQKELFKDTIESCLQMNQKEYNKMSENAYKHAVLYYENSDLTKENMELFSV